MPLLLFVLVAVVAANQNGLLRRFGYAALAQTELDLSYLLQIAIWLTAAYLANRMLEVLFWEGLLARALGASVPRLLKDVAACLVFAIALSGIAAFVFRKSVTGIWAASGVLSIVIGFALRDVILDIFIGLSLNLDRPFAIGDFIMLQQGNLVGRVKDINWRTTRLETSDNNTLIVPNSRMGDMLLTNFSKPDTRAEFELPFNLDFAVPADRALRVLSAAVLAVAGADGILAEPEPKVRIKGVTASGVDYKVKYWIDSSRVGPGKARHIVLKSALDQLHQAGLSLAHAQQDVFYAPLPNRVLDGSSAQDRQELLRRIELFALLKPSELEALAENMTPALHPARSTLLSQGEPGASMFIVLEGLLDVHISFDAERAAVKVAQIRAGEFLGEMSLLTGEARTATVTAAVETVAYEITKEQIGELIAQRPELVEVLSRGIARRKLANSEAYQRATDAEQREQHDTLARQIMNRIQSFFRGGRPPASTPVTATSARS
ncbi:MAG: cyclic nucleotide-binding domain-containing protein [Chloroflexota bacterium]